MGVLDRIGQVLRANINDLLDHAEDPEKILNQILRDMEESLRQGQSQVAERIAQKGVAKAGEKRSERRVVNIAPSQTLTTSGIVKLITKESKPAAESHVESKPGNRQRVHRPAQRQQCGGHARRFASLHWFTGCSWIFLLAFENRNCYSPQSPAPTNSLRCPRSVHRTCLFRPANQSAQDSILPWFDYHHAGKIETLYFQLGDSR